LASPTWDASKKYLKEQSEDLLTEWAVHIARKFARQVPDSFMIAQRVRLLESSLEVSIDKAYEAVKESW
jgi:hypothetical protein